MHNDMGAVVAASAANAALSIFVSFPASSALSGARQAKGCGLLATAPQNAASAASAVAAAVAFCSI